LENCKSLIIGEYKNGKSINQIVDELRLKCGLKTTRKRVSEFLKRAVERSTVSSTSMPAKKI
jgi:hypothetical protein